MSLQSQATPRINIMCNLLRRTEDKHGLVKHIEL